MSRLGCCQIMVEKTFTETPVRCEEIVKKMQLDLNIRSIKVDFDDLNTELFTAKFDLIILWNV